MDQDENKLMEPPRYDMLTVKFRGDTHSVVLPYCEVANGQIVKITQKHIYIDAADKHKPAPPIELHFEEFVVAVEESFDVKEIVGLAVQRAGSFETIYIL